MKKHCLADVAKVSWEGVVSVTNDIDSMVETKCHLFSSIIEKHTPIRDIRLSDRNCPWVNTDLKALVKSRDRLKRRQLALNRKL